LPGKFARTEGIAKHHGKLKMGAFRRKVPRHTFRYIQVTSPRRTGVGTIVGAPTDKIRVAVATQDKKIVTKYNILLRKKHFLVLDGYDPRIHALYFCPQLYKYNSDKQLVPLEGEEIGKLLAQSVKDGAVAKLPWYEPSNNLPPEPIIFPTIKTEFDTMIVGEPTAPHT
jgi:hypothetical protein